ncbi:uncharacterized protein LOC123527402 [Mercenaria mercenaria]|uniref:uncharacterized protein LOC123527402 n=1 Tax=Mercenaria mercenaria TaxID=6596 RepID=UPI00234ED8A5|nr:uncharacterized protein LOC123527402 [Mercenaria mercenaria]
MRRVTHNDRYHSSPHMKRFVSAQKMQEQAKELAYLQSAELVTPCRLFLVLIGSVVMILLISLSISSEQLSYNFDISDFQVNLTKEPYHMNYKNLLQKREEMLLHYGYSSSDNKVEKRSELPLQEFWDLYDGKWPVIVSDIVPNWKAYKNWGKDFFYNNYGADRIIFPGCVLTLFFIRHSTVNSVGNSRYLLGGNIVGNSRYLLGGNIVGNSRYLLGGNVVGNSRYLLGGNVVWKQYLLGGNIVGNSRYLIGGNIVENSRYLLGGNIVGNNRYLLGGNIVGNSRYLLGGNIVGNSRYLLGGNIVGNSRYLLGGNIVFIKGNASCLGDDGGKGFQGLCAIEGRARTGILKEGVAHIRDMKTFISHLEHPSEPNSWTYMEDEMFLMLRPELKKDIGNNYITDENFFNLFPYEVRPWDCMMLWGTKYSRSTLHMDPYNWTAISAVIWGRKKWKLFPPGQDQYLYIQAGNKCGFPLECKKYDSIIDAFDPDYWKFPKFRKAEYLEVEQNSGEMLIIPSGWYHQAYNDEETLSISMELMNRNNYLVVLEEIIRGKNLSRKKLPAHFHTLLPPDQVTLFMSLLPKKILKHGKDVTDDLLNTVDVMRNRTADLQQPLSAAG